jgi:hypothetical protein
MLWAYFAFSQFLIIWSGNLPEENVWYLALMAGNWQWLGLAAVCLEFALPFCLLLSRDWKQDPRRLMGVATLVFVMQFIYMAWTILPSFRPAVLEIHLADIAAPAALGGVWLAAYATVLARRLENLAPTHA